MATEQHFRAAVSSSPWIGFEIEVTRK